MKAKPIAVTPWWRRGRMPLNSGYDFVLAYKNRVGEAMLCADEFEQLFNRPVRARSVRLFVYLQPARGRCRIRLFYRGSWCYWTAAKEQYVVRKAFTGPMDAWLSSSGPLWHTIRQREKEVCVYVRAQWK